MRHRKNSPKSTMERELFFQNLYICYSRRSSGSCATPLKGLSSSLRSVNLPVFVSRFTNFSFWGSASRSSWVRSSTDPFLKFFPVFLAIGPPKHETGCLRAPGLICFTIIRPHSNENISRVSIIVSFITKRAINEDFLLRSRRGGTMQKSSIPSQKLER